ncbi:hypothetical protein CDV36_015122 [Fusarium kuroshium]|uniref:Uncharacterized protein n=1 Tax=Fusarium kuroshium TaxID=2010991 RepID=A0A3M2REJ4_9HYPO|nr:hypothetical protein CDV36_015122 [Fusarium kuroshium]
MRVIIQSIDSMSASINKEPKTSIKAQPCATIAKYDISFSRRRTTKLHAATLTNNSNRRFSPTPLFPKGKECYRTLIRLKHSLSRALDLDNIREPGSTAGETFTPGLTTHYYDLMVIDPEASYC